MLLLYIFCWQFSCKMSIAILVPVCKLLCLLSLPLSTTVLRYIHSAMHIWNALPLTVTLLMHIRHTVTVVGYLSQVPPSFCHHMECCNRHPWTCPLGSVWETLWNIWCQQWNGMAGGSQSKRMSSTDHPRPFQLYLPLKVLFLQL